MNADCLLSSLPFLFLLLPTFLTGKKSLPSAFFSSSSSDPYSPPIAAHLYLIPHNITIVLTKWFPPAIRVSWTFYDQDDVCEAFQIVYHPINSRYRYIVEVPSFVRNVSLDRLLPATEYLLTVNPLIKKGEEQGYNHQPPSSAPSNLNSIRFISPQTEFNRFSKIKSTSLRIKTVTSSDEKYAINLGEILLVAFLLFVWFMIILLFIKKWGKIRTPLESDTNPAAIALAFPSTPSLKASRSNPNQSVSYNTSKEEDDAEVGCGGDADLGVGNSGGGEDEGGGGGGSDRLHPFVNAQNASPALSSSRRSSAGRARINSLFVCSSSGRSSLFPEEDEDKYKEEEEKRRKRYKSAEDLSSLLMLNYNRDEEHV